MKYADMPTGMLEGRILELLEELAIARAHGAPTDIAKLAIRDARAELAKRKNG